MHRPQQGQLLRVRYARPGAQEETIGVVVFDKGSGDVFTRFRPHWDGYDEDAVIILTALEGDLRQMTAAIGGAALCQHLLDTLSNTILVTDPQAICSDNLQDVLDRTFEQEVLSARDPGGLPTSTGQMRRAFTNRTLAAAAATIAASVVIAAVNFDTSREPLNITVQPTVTDYRNIIPLTTAPVVVAASAPLEPPAGPRRLRRRGRHRPVSLPPRQYVVPTAPDRQVPEPELVDTFDAQIASSITLSGPEVEIVYLAPPPERRGRSLLQALAMPFRRLGRILGDRI